MNTHAEIHFNPNSFDDGFGFTIMKTAYLYGITGRMDYSPTSGAIIQAEGDIKSITEFVGWIKSNTNNHVNCIKSLDYTGKFKEFDISRNA